MYSQPAMQGPVRAARVGPVPIWPRALQWPHMGLTARVLWRLNDRYSARRFLAV